MTSSPSRAADTLAEVLHAAWTRNRAALTAACSGRAGAALRADPLMHWDGVWAIFGWLGVDAAVTELDRAHAAPPDRSSTRYADRRFLLALDHLLGGAVELRKQPPACAVPLETHLGLPTVAITIAGLVTRWVVDTGSSTSAISRELADRVNTVATRPDAARVTSDSAGNRVELVPGVVTAAKLADVALPAVVVAVVDLPAAAGIDGVLSVADLCTAAAVDLDLRAGRLTIAPELPGTGRLVSVRWVDDAPTVTAEVAGYRTTLMVDTGAVVDIADPELVTRAGLTLQAVERPGLLAAAGGTDRPAERAHAHVDLIGAKDRIAASFVVRACRPSRSARGPGTWSGLLGMPTLASRRLLFDSGGARLWWQAPPSDVN